MAGLNVNSADLPEVQDFGPLPAGEYVVEVIESDCVMHEKAGRQPNGDHGRRVTLTMQVIEGDYIGRRIWERADIDREVTSSKTGEVLRIDAARFNGLLKALDAGHVEDTTQLHGQPFIVRVAVKQDDPNYASKNEVKGYKSAGAPPVVVSAPRQQQPRPQAAQQRPAAQPAAAPARAGGMPWKR